MSATVPVALSAISTAMPSRATRRKNAYGMPLSALPSVALVNILIAYLFLYAQQQLFAKHPYLRPLAVALALLAELSLYATVNRSVLYTYHAALHTRAHPHPICTRCLQPRAPRTHHCATCALCIPRMSHHCHVLGVCLGAHNLKPFLYLLLYGALSATVLLLYSTPPAFDIAKRVISTHPLTLPSFHTLFCMHAAYVHFVTAFGLAALLIFHLCHILLGWTLLEAYIAKPPLNIFDRRAWRRSAPFHRGVCANVRDVFGSDWRVFLPIEHASRLVTLTLRDSPP